MKGFFAFILDALRDVDVTKLQNRSTFWRLPMKKPVWPERLFCRNYRPAPGLRHHWRANVLQPVRAHKGHISNAIRIMGRRATPAIRRAGLTLSN